jgi:ubiquinone/menaquinone biosynthesis C-methylase UbiE
MVFTELNGAGDVEKFDRWSSTYETSWLQRLYFDRIHKGVLTLTNVESAPVCIVDIGCGTGRLLRKIRERWPHARLIGVDPAEGMVRKAREMMPDSVFMVSPAESIPLPDASVDLAFSTTSFHHWSDQVQGIREIRRILRPGGQFLLADVVPLPFLSGFFHHGHMCNPPEVRKMFEQAGLEVKMQRRLSFGHFLVTAGIRH